MSVTNYRRKIYYPGCLFLYVVALAFLPKQVWADDLNALYQQYLTEKEKPVQVLPGSDKEKEVEKEQALFESGAYGDMQICAYHYTHYKEYITYCKNIESADQIRLIKCLQMAGTFNSTLMTFPGECKPELGKTAEELYQEMISMYEIAKERYDNTPFMATVAYHLMVTTRRLGDQDLTVELIKKEIEVSVKDLKGDFNTENKEYDLKRSKEQLETRYSSALNQLWSFCRLVYEYFPECRNELYYTLKKNSLEHILKEQYQTEGERITKGWKPKPNKPKSEKRQRKIERQERPEQKETEKKTTPEKLEPAPEQSGDSSAIVYFAIGFIILLVGGAAFIGWRASRKKTA